MVNYFKDYQFKRAGAQDISNNRNTNIIQKISPENNRPL